MYNYFFEKMGQAQNVRKNYICEKGGVNSNFYFVFRFPFFCFFLFFYFYYITKDGQQIFTKKKMLRVSPATLSSPTS